MGQKAIHTKSYTKADDGLFYRSVDVNGRSYQVPMYVNRLPYGWQVRFCRQGESYFSRSFADSKTGFQKPHDQVAAALKSAIDEVKTQFNQGNHDSRDELKTKISRFLMQEKTKSDTNIPGVNCSLVFPKPSDREKTPYIRLFTQLGVVANTRLSGPNYTKSIFTFTPSAFKSALKNVALHRKYMEQQHLLGKPYAPSAVPHFSREKVNGLLEGLDLEIYQFDAFIAEAETSWALIHQSKKFDVSFVEDNGDFIVKRSNKKSNRRLHESIFKASVYGSRDMAFRIAKLYQAYIERIEPYKGTYGRPIKSTKPSHIKNKTRQQRTDVIGVTFRRGSSDNAIDFVSLYWKEGVSSPVENRFSVLRYGLYGAFEKSRLCFNRQRNLDENDISIEFNFKRMLPKFLDYVTQEQIEYLGVANELEGISFSKAATQV